MPLLLTNLHKDSHRPADFLYRQIKHYGYRMNYVYLVRCSDDTLYCGWTTDLEQRVAAHNKGAGAKYTRSRRPVELVYFEEFSEKHDALSREWHIKRMSREEKTRLIQKERPSI